MVLINFIERMKFWLEVGQTDWAFNFYNFRLATHSHDISSVLVFILVHNLIVSLQHCNFNDTKTEFGAIQPPRTLPAQARLLKWNHDIGPISQPAAIRPRQVWVGKEISEGDWRMRWQVVTSDAPFQLLVHLGLPQQPQKRRILIIKSQKVYLVEYGAGFFVERTAKESI